MVTVIAHAEHPLDHLGDPQRRPQIGVIPVSHGAAQQCAQQVSFLAGGEPSRASRSSANLEARLALPLVGFHPAHHRTGCASEATRDGVQRQPFLNQQQRASSSRLQHLCGTRQSHEHLPVEATAYCISYAADNTAPGPASALRELALEVNLAHGSVHFRLEGRARSRSLVVSGPKGRRVRTLVLSAGANAVSWHGRDGAGRAVSAGLYFATLNGRDTTPVRFTLLR